jgi:hypothetical protein
VVNIFSFVCLVDFMKGSMFCALVLMVTSVPSVASPSTPSALVEADQMIQQLPEGQVVGASFNDRLAKFQVLLQEGLRLSAGNPIAERKHDLLAGQTAQLANRGGMRNLEAKAVAHSDLTMSTSCEHALELLLDQPISFNVRAETSVWLRISNFEAVSAMSTVGSAADVALSWRADCGGPITAFNDDTVGLQAVMAIPSAEGVLQIENLSGSGRVILSPTVVATVQGRVTAFDGNAPLAGVPIHVYRNDIELLGSGVSAANGNYSVAVEIGGSSSEFAYVRTARPVASHLDYIDVAYLNADCSLVGLFSNPITGCGNPITLQAIQLTPGVTTATVDLRPKTRSAVLVRVSNDADGTPVPAWVQLLSDTGGPVQNGYTDAAGRVVFRDLSADRSYRLLTLANQFQGETYDNVNCSAPSCATNGNPVQVAPGEVRQIAVGLTPIGIAGAAISVRKAGFSNQSATLRLYRPNGNFETTLSSFDGVFRNFPTGSFLVVAGMSDENAQAQLYPGIQCSSQACRSQLAQGTPLQLPPTENLEIVLQEGPVIRGVITNEATGAPVPGVDVKATLANDTISRAVRTDAEGRFRFAGLDPANYRLRTESEEWVDEVWPGLPCDPPLLSMQCADGALVAFNGQDREVNFALVRSAKIRGIVRGQLSIHPVQVHLVGIDGSILLSTFPIDGHYELSDIPSGNWLVGTYYGVYYFPQMLGGLPCRYPVEPAPAFSLCSPSSPVTLAPGEVKTEVNFASLLPRGLRVLVRDDTSLLPLSNIAVDTWAPSHRQVVTGANGLAIFPYSPDEVRISTDNDVGYIDEVYQDIPCPFGSAYSGLCGLQAGVRVYAPLWHQDPNFPPVTINLQRQPTALLFQNGFE